jgi:hypothetical protein
MATARMNANGSHCSPPPILSYHALMPGRAHRRRPLVEAQPSTTVWFAFRLSETTYGAFAAFADAADRDALLATGGPQLSKKYAHLFAEAPTFDKVDVLEARL